MSSIFHPKPFVLALVAFLTPVSGVLAQPKTDSSAAKVARPSPAPSAAQLSDDFDRELRLLFRMVACAGNEPIPSELEPVVARHCALFEPIMATYKTKHVAVAQPFLASLQPKGLSTTVVYPFGGGDLLSALTTYPNLTEVTTLSLEYAGDPRRIVLITPERLDLSLAQVRRRVSGLLIWTESTSENMMQLQKGDIPGQLAFFLTALAVHGQEPVSLRFFKLSPEGAPVYLSAADVAALERSTATRLNKVWKSPDFSVAFSNSEITFRKAFDPKAPLRVHRHIAADLSNSGLRKVPAILKHLEAKGRVTALVKAASYLLWNSGFSRIRDYLLVNMDFMLSDSTGIPPHYCQKAGFEVLAYGEFDAPFLPAPEAEAADMLALFAAQPRRELTFRYGYPDIHSHHHLLVTRKPEKPPTAK
ncbi:MAG: hypothetical protein ABI565_00870 [Vicinamibacteria bacterium]